MIQALCTPCFKVVLNLRLELISHSEWMKPGWCASRLDHKPIDLGGYRDWLSPVYLTTAAFSQLHCSWVFNSLSSPTEETRQSWEGHWLTNELPCTDNGVRLEMAVNSARKRLLNVAYAPTMPQILRIQRWIYDSVDTVPVHWNSHSRWIHKQYNMIMGWVACQREHKAWWIA